VRPLPPAPPPPPAADAFLLLPLFSLSGGGLSAAQLALYAWALEMAREVARPSLPERDLLAVWN
jgi:hypothetical protein